MIVQRLIQRAQYQRLGLSIAAVQIDRGEYRLHHVGQYRGPLAAAHALLACGQYEIIAQLILMRGLKERFLAHQPRARPAQLALLIGIVVEQEAADRQLQYGVAQKLQPLIVGDMALAAARGVRQRGLQQRFIPKCIAQPGHERFHD